MKVDYLPTTYHRFGLTYPYKKEYVDYCRLLKESFGWQQFNFDIAHKAWVFSDYKIIEALRERFPEMEIAVDLPELMQEQKEKSKTAEYIDSLREAQSSNIVIKGLKKELYPYQKAGVDFLIQSGGRCILADDPGLGKSAQTIGFILAKGIKKTLVVCPATMKFTWEAELKKWSDLKGAVIDSDTDILSIGDDVDVFIVNYDLLFKHYEMLLESHKVKNFQLMVLDEAHYIKSPTAKRSKVVKALSKIMEFILMLTGTPVINRPVELYHPLSILEPKVWSNYYHYAKRYCAAQKTRFGLDVSGSSNIDELREKIHKYFIRRTKDEVLKELPPKVRIEVPVELNYEYQKQYDKAYNQFADFLRENKGKKKWEVDKSMQAEKLTRLNALREISATGKIAAAKEIIDSVIDSGQKIIVFSSFNFPIESLHAEYGNSVLITGKTPNEERFELVKQFQDDPEIKVFFGGIKSAGVGITLTAASNVLFLDYSWTPADHKQAEDRAHRADERTREHESITIYTLHARDTVDEQLVAMHAKKKRSVDELGLGDGEFEYEDEETGFNMVMAAIERKIDEI